jgi:hypothetical protein
MESNTPRLYTLDIENKKGNQQLLKINPVTQFINKQDYINDQLYETVQEVTSMLKSNKEEQLQYFQQLINQIKKQELTTNHVNNRVESFENTSESLLEKIKILEKQNEALSKQIEGDNQINQALIEQLTAQYSDQLVSKLEHHDTVVFELSEEVKKQQTIYETINEKLDMQEIFHKTLLERMEHQEALTQKIVRQIDHLKSIIYERFSHFAEKIENNMKLTTSYLFSFMTKPTLLKGSNIEEKEEPVKEYVKN